MKKTIVVLVTLLLGLNLFAQKAGGRGQFGIIGGLTSSNGRVSSIVNDVKNSNLNMYNVGVCYKQNLVFGIAVQPALIWNVKGAQITDGTHSGELQTGFLEIPVQVQWGKEFLLGAIRPYLFAEPFVGVGLWDKAKGFEVDNWDSFRKRFEVGIGVGLGLEVVKHVQVACRYYWNFNPMYSGTTAGGEIKSSCSGVMLTAAVLF